MITTLRTVNGDEVMATGIVMIDDLLHVIVEDIGNPDREVPLGLFSCDRAFVNFIEEHYDKDNIRNG